MLQKLLREVTKYLLIFKTALAASSARFAPTSGHGPWGDLHPEVLSVLPLSSVGTAGIAQAPSALLLLLHSPVSSLLYPSLCRPSCLAKQPGSSSQSTARHRQGQWPLHSTPAPIPPHTWASQCWRRSKTLLQFQVIHPGKQAEGFTLCDRLYLAPGRINLNPFLYFSSTLQSRRCNVTCGQDQKTTLRNKQGWAEESTRESPMMGQRSLHPQKPQTSGSRGEGLLGRHPRIFHSIPPREVVGMASPPAHPSP